MSMSWGMTKLHMHSDSGDIENSCRPLTVSVCLYNEGSNVIKESQSNVKRAEEQIRLDNIGDD